MPGSLELSRWLECSHQICSFALLLALMDERILESILHDHCCAVALDTADKSSLYCGGGVAPHTKHRLNYSLSCVFVDSVARTVREYYSMLQLFVILTIQMSDP